MPEVKSKRNASIIRYSAAGIIMNLSLAVFKLVVGATIHAHAIMLDGINSLSDSISSALSIASAAVSGRRSDKNHPMGYGRLEYVASMFITSFIIYIGVVTIIDSLRSIIHNHPAPQYNTVSVIIMIVSLICKIIYGVIMRAKGRDLGSAAMVMSGTDSMGDALISLSILAAMAIYRLTGADVEHYLCILISLTIIYTGASMMKECLDKMIGSRTDPELKKRLVGLFIEEPEVLNISNLVIHSYGEEVSIGSADIEVDENMSAGEITLLTRRLIKKAEDIGVKISSVGISGISTDDSEAAEIWDTVIDTAIRHRTIMRVSEFHYDRERRAASFYAVQDHSSKDAERDRQELCDELCCRFPGMSFEIYSAIDI